jgi:hypothetical protein
VAGDTSAPFPAETLATLQGRAAPLKAAVEAATRARSGMTREEQRFFSTDVELGLDVAERQTRAALLLEEALRAADAAEMWQRAEAARAPLEQLEIEMANLEYPPFDRWYQQSWIRTALSFHNPHRPYQQLRAFPGSDGHGQLQRGPGR